MALMTKKPPSQNPNYWQLWGHSLIMVAYGTADQTGRIDSQLRTSLNIDHGSWENRARDGAQLVQDVRANAGYARVLQEELPAIRANPYVTNSGSNLLVWGINDIGNRPPNSEANIFTAYTNALRTVISRMRASSVWLNDAATTLAYGAGFTSVDPTDFLYTSSNTALRRATTTTSATITITIPADYQGETIAICFLAPPGATGGTVTWSGTAGLTGTTALKTIAVTGHHCPVTKRYVASVTGSTQTIIATVTQIDGGGVVEFDSWWLESKTPPAVIVCDLPKPTAATYTGFYAGWTGTEAAKDANVDTFNANMASVIAEFDGMVQMAYLSAVFDKAGTDLLFDGIHPNERGAGKAVDQILAAKNRLTLVGSYGETANLNPPANRKAPDLRPRRSGLWYTTDCATTGSVYTAVAQDMFAYPIMVTAGRERWINFSIEPTNAIAGTAIRWGVFDDVGTTGYPQNSIVELTSAGAFTIVNTATIKTSPDNPTAGNIFQVMEPALYWVVVKFTTIGVAHTFKTITGPCRHMPNMLSTGGVPAAGAYPVCWKLTGQGTGAFGSMTFPTGGVATATGPVIGVKVQ